MKKLFSIIALAILIAFSASSCSLQSQSEPTDSVQSADSITTEYNFDSLPQDTVVYFD